MCARYVLVKEPSLLARVLGARGLRTGLTPRYNIAPTQPVLAVINDAERSVTDLRWGLVPPNAESPAAMKLSTFNARVETIATAPTYRHALRARRCAIFADGYYEWRRDTDGGKTPMWIHRVDGESFVFAGLWETWQSPVDGEIVRSCTIVTQPPNAFVETIHSRMPVVLDPERARAWLAPEEKEPAEVLELLVPSPATDWAAYPVNPRVGSARFDDAALLDPVPDTAAASISLFDVPPQ